MFTKEAVLNRPTRADYLTKVILSEVKTHDVAVNIGYEAILSFEIYGLRKQAINVQFFLGDLKLGSNNGIIADPGVYQGDIQKATLKIKRAVSSGRYTCVVIGTSKTATPISVTANIETFGKFIFILFDTIK